MADDGLSGLTDDEKCTPLFELMREHDLEGIVAKRLDDPYDPRVRWLRIKNPDYSQKGGKGRPVQQVMAAARAFGSPISESDTGAPMRVVQGLPVPSRAQSRRDGRTLWRGRTVIAYCTGAIIWDHPPLDLSPVKCGNRAAILRSENLIGRQPLAAPIYAVRFRHSTKSAARLSAAFKRGAICLHGTCRETAHGRVSCGAVFRCSARPPPVERQLLYLRSRCQYPGRTADVAASRAAPKPGRSGAGERCRYP